uniref:Uncharacterized protein n=1 Tax=Clytia hemisphaerica TaxID=252671 RepID=A0A7M5XE96_9CNID
GSIQEDATLNHGNTSKPSRSENGWILKSSSTAKTIVNGVFELSKSDIKPGMFVTLNPERGHKDTYWIFLLTKTTKNKIEGIFIERVDDGRDVEIWEAEGVDLELYNSERNGNETYILCCRNDN